MIVLKTPEDVVAKLEAIGIGPAGRWVLREFGKANRMSHVELPYAYTAGGEPWKEDQITLAETLVVPVSAL